MFSGTQLLRLRVIRLNYRGRLMDFNNNAQFNRALFVVSSKGEVPIQSFAKAMEYTTKHGITLDILCILPDFSPLRYSHSNSELDKLKVESAESIRNKLTNVMAHSRVPPLKWTLVKIVELHALILLWCFKVQR